jgi:predicted dehydrogenase
MATAVDDAVAIADAAHASSRLVQVGFAYRFHPRWQEVRRMVASGALTPPLCARATFTTAGGSGWRDPVVDVACHHLDLMAWLLGGPPVEVAARAGGAVVARWPDGSELSGRYQAGKPADHVSLSGGHRTVSIERLRRRGLLRRRRDVSFERAMAAFVAGVQAGRLVDGTAGPADGVASTRTIMTLRRAVSSGRTETVAAT